MKKALINILFLFSVTLFCGGNLLSQENKDTSKQNIENIHLIFSLDGSPTPEDVGFSDSKSNWKFKYELRLTDDKVLQELQTIIYAKYEKSGKEANWISKANKKLYKKWKKAGIFIAKGDFRSMQISTDESRNLKIPIPLSPEVKELLGKMNASKEMPNFILSVKGVLSTKMQTGKSFKKKYEKVLEFPMKFYKNDNEFLLYNTFGMAITITKENENIIFDLTRR